MNAFDIVAHTFVNVSCYPVEECFAVGAVNAECGTGRRSGFSLLSGVNET